MPEPNAKEVPLAGGKVSSSECPQLHLIPTEAILRLAARCELGVARKGSLAWNALTDNQEAVRDVGFILSRIDHVIRHALFLRDKIARGGDVLAGDDDAGAILWSGAFLCCATQALADFERETGKLGKGEAPGG